MSWRRLCFPGSKGAREQQKAKLPGRRRVVLSCWPAHSHAALQGRARLQQELAARRRALATADLRCEPGLRYWLERQRWLWRQGRLPTEQVCLHVCGWVVGRCALLWMFGRK